MSTGIILDDRWGWLIRVPFIKFTHVVKRKKKLNWSSKFPATKLLQISFRTSHLKETNLIASQNPSCKPCITNTVQNKQSFPSLATKKNIIATIYTNHKKNSLIYVHSTIEFKSCCMSRPLIGRWLTNQIVCIHRAHAHALEMSNRGVNFTFFWAKIIEVLFLLRCSRLCKWNAFLCLCGTKVFSKLNVCLSIRLFLNPVFKNDVFASLKKCLTHENSFNQSQINN